MMPQAMPAMEAANTVLSVRNLSIDATGADGQPIHLVQDVSFDVYEHEVLGLVGESGSGKSLTMLAVLGLLGPGLKIVSGTIVLRGQELTTMSFADLQKVSGKAVSIIFQDPLTTLNPVLRIGEQIAEAIRLHNPGQSRAEVRARVIELLTLVGIPNPERRFSQFPNEFSGGMRQRVVIAMAMANEPDLLIADEPTTALDVTIQAQILDLLAQLKDEFGMAIMLITHAMGVVAEVAQRVVVMYAGKVVEQAPVGELFAHPRHPYTQGLIRSIPRIDTAATHKVRLETIAGSVPKLVSPPEGCRFAPRCKHAQPACSAATPPLREISPGHQIACILDIEA